MNGAQIELQYWNGTKWVSCGSWFSERSAWQSLGGDDKNYRTVSATGKVLTDKRNPATGTGAQGKGAKS